MKWTLNTVQRTNKCTREIRRLQTVHQPHPDTGGLMVWVSQTFADRQGLWPRQKQTFQPQAKLLQLKRPPVTNLGVLWPSWYSGGSGCALQHSKFPPGGSCQLRERRQGPQVEGRRGSQLRKYPSATPGGIPVHLGMEPVRQSEMRRHLQGLSSYWREKTKYDAVKRKGPQGQTVSRPGF